jgi:hypothetical protein
VREQKLALDVTIGDLIVLVYLAVVVIYLARRLSAAAESELEDAPARPERRDRLDRAA